MNAETAFRRSIELNPSYSVAHQWYANYLVAMGRFDWRGQAYEELGRADDAIASLQRAADLSDRSGISVAALAHAYATAGAREQALELLAELVSAGGTGRRTRSPRSTWRSAMRTTPSSG